MKKIIVLLLALCGLSSQFLLAQSSLLTTISVIYTLPTGSGPYQPGDEIVVDFTAYNSSGHDIFINPNFELFLDNESQLLVEADPITTGPQTVGSIVFTVPDDCTLEDGAYQLQFFVTYSHNWTKELAIASTFVDDFDPICDNYAIPVGNPGISEKCIVDTLDLTLQNFPECCTYEPIIVVTATPFYPSHPWKSCKWWVHANIDWGANAPLQSNVVWNTGAYGTSLLHPCGTTDYSVTLNWMENGEWCSKVSETITVTSRCYCAHEYPPKLTVGVLSGTSIVISPNPNNGQFNFILPLNQTAFSYEVWNSSGVMILEQSGIFENSVSVDLGDVEPGIYLLTVHYESGTTETVQFIVQ